MRKCVYLVFAILALLFSNSPIFSEQKDLNIEINENKNRNLKILVMYKNCDSNEVKKDNKYFPKKAFTSKKYAETEKSLVLYKAFHLNSKDGYYLFRTNFGYETITVQKLTIMKYFKNGNCYFPKAIYFSGVAATNESGDYDNAFISKDEKKLIYKKERNGQAKYVLYSLVTLKPIGTVSFDKLAELIKGDKYSGFIEWLRSSNRYWASPWE
jgi:hypothetical protein